MAVLLKSIYGKKKAVLTGIGLSKIFSSPVEIVHVSV